MKIVGSNIFGYSRHAWFFFKVQGGKGRRMPKHGSPTVNGLICAECHRVYYVWGFQDLIIKSEKKGFMIQW